MRGPHWLPIARRLRAEGKTYAEIGQAVNRSTVRAWQALNGEPRYSGANYKEKPSVRPDQDWMRYKIRAAARDFAKEQRIPIELAFDRFGVPTLDKSRTWDRKKQGVAS